MKKLAVILCLTALTTGAFAQGLVNFFNSPTTLISYNQGGTNVVSIPSGAAGSFFFCLLTAPAGTTDPTLFSLALYGTNQAAAGRFTGGGNQAINGWVAGTTRSYLVAGWSSDMGHSFNPEWLTGIYPGAPPTGYFGMTLTPLAGPAGGTDPITGGSIPTLNIFGGTYGFTSGITLQPVPEPATMALAGLGAAALLIFRRRK